jgi:hypothetical protein
MKARLIAALLVAVSASFAAPAFASGYGPAPFYNPQTGAPASQHGPDAQTVAAERAGTADMQQAYGGMATGQAQWGKHVSLDTRDNLFAHH